MANTSTHRFETVVLGQGLAGSSLAWKLHERGESVLLIDRGDESSSSRIAAGLLTPITGQRLARYPDWGQFYNAAKAFYRIVEQQTGEAFFSETPMVRVFASSEERELFLKKYRDADDVRLCEASALPKAVSSPFGGFEMLTAARLDTKSYLAATQSYFETQCGYRQATISLPADVQVEKDRISLPRLNVECNRVVFCQGFESTKNPWFRDVPFDAAKGEILTLKVSDWEESRVVHAGIWVAPEQNGHVRIGATYERDQLDKCPTEAGRTDLLKRWSQLQNVSQEEEIVEHRAAVRPVIHGRSPRMGVHPNDTRLGFMNGLGSRGALLSPVLADQMRGLLCEGIAVDNKYDLHQKVDLSSCFV
ncbi:MAG: FAD-dependent oxidoreductase [Planctomycetaceae bacterium]|jgi:glycine oxidase|nr:FAD-binding oxidoreductase [Planctomycetaceae bacterium]MDG2388414.1 FAD-dependent oxidoreductase [Planctomycetaceae bacterium]